MMRPVEILPAVLAYSADELKEKLAALAGVAPRVQIDVVDGRLAKHKSWPYKDGADFKAAAAEEGGLPQWEHLSFEFDLMVDDPAAVTAEYIRAGATRLIVHAASRTAGAALEMMARLNERDGGAPVVAAGLAIGLNEHPDALLPFNDLFDYVQVMGIAQIGVQGEPFDERALVLVERLRHRYPEAAIQVDGGITLERVRPLVAAGATRLVVGSAIAGADDKKAAYEALYNEANGA